ncbi:molybdate transport system substrate-binding protein [Lachnospiraceae bacterium]|nr:molybdate transport system substrate-binding protein [Lachnospiraceae bacterium]
MKKIAKVVTALITASALVMSLTACGASDKVSAAGTSSGEGADTASSAGIVEDTAFSTEVMQDETEMTENDPTEIQVFIAASLNNVMQEVAAKYNEKNPDVKIVFNADSSGTLLAQIEEGYACDVFFSAAQKQMNILQDDDGLVVDGTRHNVVNNQVCVIKRSDTETAVTGLSDISKASSIALADGSVPVGKYTREAMVNAGILPENEDVSKISTKEVSDALGGVEISEQSNVSKVLAAVVEGSCEVGTTYYSDTYGYEKDIEIIEKVPYELTGDVIYPVAQIKNDEADDAEVKAARDFVDFIVSDEAKEIFDKYYFDTDVEK